MKPKTLLDGNRIDLFLERETPVRSWPDSRLMFTERFSFPKRCALDVIALEFECEELCTADAHELVVKRRREILWGMGQIP